MYLARANFVYRDNTVFPNVKVGCACCPDTKILYEEPTVADLLLSCGVSFKVYAQGYDVVKRNPTNSSYCWPEYYQATDIPFQYYKSTADDPKIMLDVNQLADDVQQMQLPAVSFIRSLGNASEHPVDSNLKDGQDFVTRVTQTIMNSDYYREKTLFVIVQDESGGYEDHYPLPNNNNMDGYPFSARLPAMIVGHFAKRNYVSHVPLEHSSLVKFVQWNFLDGTPGYLRTRDRTANNMLDLLDLNK